LVMVIAVMCGCKKNEASVDPTEIETEMTEPTDVTGSETDNTAVPGVEANDFEDSDFEEDETTEATEEATDSTEPSEEETDPTEEETKPEDTDPTEGDTITDFEWYNSLSGAEQQEFMNTFESVEAFFEWYNAAKSEYDALHPDVEINDGNIDLEGKG